MKKIQYMIYVLVFGSVALTLNGCKKGEYDPALQLTSRSEKITKTWVLTSIDWEEIDEDANSTITFTSTYDGTLWKELEIEVFTDGSPSNTLTDNTDSFTYEVRFDDNGTSLATQVKNGTIRTETGDWNWSTDLNNKRTLNISNTLILGSNYTVDLLTEDNLTLSYSRIDHTTKDGAINRNRSWKYTYYFTKK